jgi:hypothetical protein
MTKEFSEAKLPGGRAKFLQGLSRVETVQEKKHRAGIGGFESATEILSNA